MDGMLSRRRFLLAAAALTGCAGTPPPEVAPPPIEAEPAPVRLRDAHTRAAEIVGAKLEALLHTKHLVGHPLAPRLVAMDAWGGIFEGTGLDPLRDLDRAFVAAANARDRTAVVAVAEHHVPEADLAAAIDKLVQQSGTEGQVLDGLAAPAARVSVRGQTSVVIRATPTLLVVTSDQHAAAAAASLRESGGLPESEGPEAVIARVDYPSKTLKARGAPQVPDTIARADATVTMSDDGGADLVVIGKSTNEEQARADAAELTDAIDRATTVKISVVKIRAFDPIVFEAKGDRIEGRRHLTANELATLLRFAEMAAAG